MKKEVGIISIFAAISLVLSGCGGGSNSDSTQTTTTVDAIKTGYFKDSAVQGLDYVSCDDSYTTCLEGTTGVYGDFKYREGNSVKFKLGDLVIAEGPAKPLLIPADVSKDENSSVKLGQLLMTLDEDNDPSTGIKIPYAVNQNAKNMLFKPDANFYNLTKDDVKLQKLVNDVSDEEKTLVSESDVEEHLKLSARLKILKLSSVPIQHYLGEKFYNSSDGSNYNARVLNINPKKRLLLGIWQEKKKGLIAKSVEYSEKTTQEEKEKARLDYAISVAKGVVDTALLLADPKEMAKDSAALKITGTAISLYSDGVKVGADIDVGAHTDLAKGILGGTVGMMDSSKGLTSGFVRGGAKDLILSGMTYAEVDDSYKVAFDSLAWPILDNVWENAQSVVFEPNKAEILADQIEKIAKAAVNVRAAIHISANTSVSDTIHAAMEYLDAYYLSAGDRDFMLSQHNMPIDIQAAYQLLNKRAEATSTWQDWVKFGSPPIEKSLFMTYVSESIVGISASMRIYSAQLSPSQTDVKAILTPLPQKVCNGATFELRATTDKGFEQDPNDLSNVVWQIPSDVTSEVSGLTNRVTFNKAGYYSIGVTMDIAIEGQEIGVGDFTEVLVQPCVDMNLDYGMSSIEAVETTATYTKYKANVKDGYNFYSWSQNNGKAISSNDTYIYYYDSYNFNATINATSKADINLGPLNYKGVDYNTVVSPFTGRVWLDRDINASSVCSESNDTTCIGSGYSWSSDLDVLGNDEFENATITQKNLQNISGVGICPLGYRIPTKDEFRIETIAQEVTSKEDAFNNFLKLGFDNVNYINKYWTSDYEETTNYAYPVTIINDGGTLRVGNSSKISKYRFRCIHNTLGTNSIPTLSDAISIETVANSSVDANISVHDIDGDTLVYELTSSPKNGIISGSLPNIQYLPSQDYTGYDSFSFRVNDGHGYSNIQDIRVIVYGEVTSTTTNRIWLDRNLGAEKVCDAMDEWACFGYYYQWGRGNDGHQDYKRKTIGNYTSVLSVSTNGFANTLDSAGDKYYTTVGGFGDWVNEDAFGVERMKRWKSSNGSSICPVGYRVPSSEELLNETQALSTNKAVYDSFLKIPSNGKRLTSVNSVVGTGNSARLWTSDRTTRVIDGQRFVFMNQADAFEFDENNAGVVTYSNDTGLGVRCIKAE